jgi:hypothetical protein
MIAGWARRAGIAAWLVTMISWLPLADIESRALSQPDHASARYTEPMHLKGVVRYVTPDQKLWDRLAHFTFTSGWIVGFASFGIALLLAKREKKNSN